MFRWEISGGAVNRQEPAPNSGVPAGSLTSATASEMKEEAA